MRGIQERLVQEMGVGLIHGCMLAKRGHAKTFRHSHCMHLELHLKLDKCSCEMAISGDQSLQVASLAAFAVPYSLKIMPPLCWLGLATSMGQRGGGAYNVIRVSSLVYTPPFLDTVVCTTALNHNYVSLALRLLFTHA